MPVERPIIVLGAPRSGTTLLAALLGTHPACVRAREARLVWRYGNDGRPDDLEPSHATPKVVDHIRSSFAEIVRAGGGGRLVEKTPANSVRPWFVDAVFPDARYVHITRDGWACVPSIRDFWESRSTGLDAKQRAKAGRRLREMRPSQIPHYAGELARRALPGRRGTPPLYGPRVAGLDGIVEDLGLLQASAHQWHSCVTRSAAFGHEIGGRYLEVKLEELDEAALRALLSFCELDPDPRPLDEFRTAYDPVIATRRRALSDDEQRRLAPVVEPVNAWLGYRSEP